MAQRLGFGVFLPPFHPPSEHPTLQLESDLETAEILDDLGFDELWIGEHQPVGWELVGSPEMFLAAAAQRTKRIRLGTGVVSMPYHHPFSVAERIALLDHLSCGRAMLGVGPGALPSDAYMLGIESTTQRPRMEEGLGVILRLLYGDEPVTHKSEWFTLQEAALQLRPLQPAYPGRGGITDIARRDADRRQIRNRSAFAGFILGTGTASFTHAMADWADRRCRAQPAPRPVQIGG